jgi:hypothetical protein
MGTCVHFSRSLPSNSWWQRWLGGTSCQGHQPPKAGAEGGGRRPAFTGLATSHTRPPRSTAGNINSAGCLKTGPQYTRGGRGRSHRLRPITVSASLQLISDPCHRPLRVNSSRGKQGQGVRHQISRLREKPFVRRSNQSITNETREPNSNKRNRSRRKVPNLQGSSGLSGALITAWLQVRPAFFESCAALYRQSGAKRPLVVDGR